MERDEAKAALFAKHQQYGSTFDWADGEDVIIKLTLEGKMGWGL
jgi:hypothetical protein